MKTNILILLREKKDYVSGQQLCEQFGVSRTAVWKAIGQLRKEGYVIDAVPRKGYRLVEQTGDNISADSKREAVTTEIYTKNEIASRMKTRWAGQQVYFYDEIGSTNIEAKRLAEAGAEHGTLVVADMQTAGRGRRGRSWISPAGTNIYFTIVLKPEFAPDKASMLTLVIAHAIARTFREVLGLQSAGIKWPNDIVIDGRKTCGILTEMSVEQDDIQYVVIGVGINVRKQEFSPEIADRAIALDEVCAEDGANSDNEICAGGRVNRSRLLAAIMCNFEADYEAFTGAGAPGGNHTGQEAGAPDGNHTGHGTDTLDADRTQNETATLKESHTIRQGRIVARNCSMAPLRGSYNAMLVNLDREVCVLDPAGEYSGVARGIDDRGELIVELPDGSRREVFAGEVSVRGIYGYV